MISADREGRLATLLRASMPQGIPPDHSGFRLLHDGAHALDARVALANSAQHSLDAQYYIVATDTSGKHFLAALGAAAARGVRVRLLVDDLHADDTDRAMLDLCNRANVEIRLFNPLPARGGQPAARVVRSLREFERINRRMHNKLFIADGVLSVSGGRNIADEYFMRAADANFIDMDVLAGGPVVADQSVVFDRYWNSGLSWPAAQLARPVDATHHADTRPPATERSSLDLVPASPDIFGHRSLSHELALGRLQLVWAPAQVLADAPEKAQSKVEAQGTRGTVSEHVLQACEAATSQIFISSPYFVPDAAGLEAIRAARQRDVQVTLVTNSVGASDEPLVHTRYVDYRSSMLDLGVLVYEISPLLPGRVNSLGAFKTSRGRLHSKLVVVDQRWFYIGSMNFDRRSASVNTEAGLLIDSPELAAQFKFILDLDRFRSAYRVTRDAQGATVWLESAPEGGTLVRKQEPHLSVIRALWGTLLSLFIDEEWL